MVATISQSINVLNDKDWELDTSTKNFLRSIAEAVKPYSGILVGNKPMLLLHPFWTFEEIIQGRKLQAEWNVRHDLIPFYGDWHTLMCFSCSTGHILLLSDDRKTLHRWCSSQTFMESLTDSLELESVAHAHHTAIEKESWLDF